MPRARKKPPPDPDDLIEAVRAVPGVVDVTLDGNAAPDSGLQVTLEPGCDETAVSAAVDAVLRERFGLAVDEEAVAVVEDVEIRRADGGAAAAPDAEVRPTIDRMHVVSTGEGVTASVTISVGRRAAVGEASGAGDDLSVLITVATATLLAAVDLVDGRAVLDADRVDIVDTGDQRTALVRVVSVEGGQPRQLTGAAVVRDDVRQAVIRATLHAVNRRLALLLAADRTG